MKGVNDCTHRGPWPAESGGLRGPGDVEVELTVLLGTAELTLEEASRLTQGQVVELDRFVDDPVDLLLNGQLVGRGEVVMEEEGPMVIVTDVLESR
ncbi:MAG: FliM/FliN family flagellar motor switch protein [Acidobacteriota bacterium]